MFFVIEGIDGAGCETQAQLVSSELNRQNMGTVLLKYPHYTDPVGLMIKDFLYANKSLSPHQQFLLYGFQFLHDRPKINSLAQTKIVIADRYFSSTLCYQVLEGVSEKTALRFAEDFQIVKPDLIFYLDVPPLLAYQRKTGEKKEKNFREKDIVFMKKTYRRYDKMVKSNLWADWERVDGRPHPKIIANQIVGLIKKRMKHENHN